MDKLKKQGKKRSPWAWIPTLYFAEGLPYIAVNVITVILYKKLGMSNADIAFYTGWLYLPWVIKPFWSPFVDILKTKRWWTVIMQLALGIGFAAIAFTIPTSMYLQLTLAIFWIIGFASATHDIAADGFYMLALEPSDQSLFVGIRSTFYRCATIFGQGILVIIAGSLELSTGKEPINITVLADSAYSNEIVLPETQELLYADCFMLSSDTVKFSTENIPIEKADSIKKMVHEHNSLYGFIPKDEIKREQSEEKSGWWKEKVSTPFGDWIARNFGEKLEVADTKSAGALSIVAVSLANKLEGDDNIVLSTALKKGDKSIALVMGERIEFTPDNWDQPAYLLFQADSKLTEASFASFRGLSGNIPLAWSITFMILAALFLVLFVYHRFILPTPPSDKPVAEVTAKSIFKEFLVTFKTFFTKKQVWVAILFMLLYRLPEAQLIKLINPFLLDGRDIGGLGLTTGQVGLVYGTIGILGLTIGGIIGGIVASRGGLRKWLWPMAWSISLSCAAFCYLSIAQPDPSVMLDMILINASVFIEQFGYGFGFTAFMLYMMYFSEGEHKTSHYAICTAFMALGMMVPGMFAGWIQEKLGYVNFFWWVMICCIATIVVTALVKVDPEYGKKKQQV